MKKFTHYKFKHVFISRAREEKELMARLAKEELERQKRAEEEEILSSHRSENERRKKQLIKHEIWKSKQDNKRLKVTYLLPWCFLKFCFLFFSNLKIFMYDSNKMNS